MSKTQQHMVNVQLEARTVALQVVAEVARQAQRNERMDLDQLCDDIAGRIAAIIHIAENNAIHVCTCAVDGDPQERKELDDLYGALKRRDNRIEIKHSELRTRALNFEGALAASEVNFLEHAIREKEQVQRALIGFREAVNKHKQQDEEPEDGERMAETG